MHRFFAKVVSAFGIAGVAVALATTQGFAANQAAFNNGTSSAANGSATQQNAGQNQNANNASGAGGCGELCTGGGGNISPQAQQLSQNAITTQQAVSLALANQHALNANVPVTIVGTGTVADPSSSANQAAANNANSQASNASSTGQNAGQNQQAANASGAGGCGQLCTGGGGNISPQAQAANQNAATNQAALSVALGKQNLLNANVPVTIVGSGNVADPSSGANQLAANSANSQANNKAATQQNANQNQQAANASGAGGCGRLCTGGGGNLSPQLQGLGQNAVTNQAAASLGTALQLLNNANAGVNIG